MDTYIIWAKDTGSKHINPIKRVLVVVPVGSVVAAQQRPGLIALMLKAKKTKENGALATLHHYMPWQINTTCPLYLPLWASRDRNILRRQEEDDAHSSRIHFTNWNGEDQDPGDEASHRVNNHQRRISQQQPHVGGKTTLYNKKGTEIASETSYSCIVLNVRSVLYIYNLVDANYISIYPVGSAQRLAWHLWEWHLWGWWQQKCWVIFFCFHSALTVWHTLTASRQCVSYLEEHDQKTVLFLAHKESWRCTVFYNHTAYFDILQLQT